MRLALEEVVEASHWCRHRRRYQCSRCHPEQDHLIVTQLRRYPLQGKLNKLHGPRMLMYEEAASRRQTSANTERVLDGFWQPSSHSMPRRTLCRLMRSLAPG